MKISKRSLYTVIALVLTLSVTAFGTVAYMTDRDQVVNTFTVGNINIVVDEKNVDNDADVNGNIPERDQANEYKLIPGMVYDKDPTMTVKAGSEECFVRMRVELNCHSELLAATGKTGYELLALFVKINSDWQQAGEPVVDLVNDVIAYEFRYVPTTEGETEKVNAATDKKLQALFDTFTVPSSLTADDLAELISGEFNMKVYGDAVQTATFNNASDAWAAYDNQFANTQEPTPGPSDTTEVTPTPAPTEVNTEAPAPQD